MFTNIQIKNYKSLIDLELDLTYKQGKMKPLAIIYGENGVGKTNLASVFFTLYESLRTMTTRNQIQQLINDRENGERFDENILQFFKEKLPDTETIIKKCKTNNSNDNMVLSFAFDILGSKGEYVIEYNSIKLVHEKLSYALNKNKTVLYDISDNGFKINDKIFVDNDYALEFRDLLNKYWGKHTLLSILVSEIEDKVDGYVEKRIHNRLYNVIARFITMSIKVKTGYGGERGTLGLTHEILLDLDKGEINIKDEDELNRAELLLNDFFSVAYSDIKEIYYRKVFSEDKIKYSLVFRKLMYDTVVDVDVDNESTGTLRLLEILPFLLMCVEGQTVIIDEIDMGIHDLLVSNMIGNIFDSINGQLIITTHNTMLLDSDIDPKYIYTFMVDENANKKILPIIDYEDRVHPNLNYRNRYLKGMYGGVPMIGDIDFEALCDLMNWEE